MIFIIKHPLITHKLTNIRNKKTNMKEFRENFVELANLMFYEATKCLKLSNVTIDTPMKKNFKTLQFDKKIILLPILRAGLGMLEGILNLIPTAKIGHIGIFRNKKTLIPINYYKKFPITIKNKKNTYIFILEPMLATGGTVINALNILKKKKILSKNIKLISLISSSKALKKIKKYYPKIDIYLATIDKKLNNFGYIVPGLGDAGDRFFGTK